MLAEAVLLGSRIFHEEEPAGAFYDAYLRSHPVPLVDSPEDLDLSYAQDIRTFLNQWRTHYQGPAQRLESALRTVLPELAAVRDASILDADLERPDTMGSVGSSARRVFEAVVAVGPRREVTGAAKVLHMLHPRLFVMWDSAIACGYAVPSRTAEDYVTRFLPRMQRLARLAVAQYARAHGVSESAAVTALCRCGHSFPKVLDEYNYAKYTLSSDRVWDAEWS